MDIAALAKALGGRMNGSGAMVLCPAHDDHNPSLSIQVRRGKVLYHCHAGCSQEAVLTALIERGLGGRHGGKVNGRIRPASIEQRDKSDKPPLGPIIATYDYCDAAGHLLYQVMRHEPKEYRQRRPDGLGGWIYNMKGVDRVLYRLQELLASDPGQPVFICEGEKDVDNVRALGLVATSAPLGAGKWHLVKDVSALYGREFIILPDHDKAGRDHADQVAANLQGIAGRVKVLHLAAEHSIHGYDVSDWVAEGGTGQQLLALAAAAMEWQLPPEAHNGGHIRPAIIVSGRYRRDTTTDALNALAQANGAAPKYFRWSGGIGRLVSDGTGLVELMGRDALGGVLDREADFLKLVGQERVTTPTRPPDDVVADILSLPEADLPLPKLKAIATAPVFLPTGLLAKEGYDPPSGIYLAMGNLGAVSTEMPLPEALSIIDDLLSDFAFDSAGSRAGAIAFLLLPFVRPLIDGHTPLHLFDAPTPRTGKGLMAEVLAETYTGGPLKILGFVREEEMEKRLVPLLMEGWSHIFIDNIPQGKVLDSGQLSRVLTSRMVGGRLLGQSKSSSASNGAVWLAAGNNVEVSTEIAGRTVHIRLDSRIERPGERTGFTHPDLRRWAKDNRSRLVSACLSIIHAWWDAGRPKGRQVLGNFEAWAETVGGILDVAGIGGLLSNREFLHLVADSEAQEWGALCVAWHAQHGNQRVSANQVYEVAKSANLLLPLWAGRSLRGAQSSFGRALKSQRDRVYGGHRIEYKGADSRTGNASYAVS